MPTNLKHLSIMKKVLLFLVCFVPIFLFSQSHSWDGMGIRSDEKIHYLNIFVNIIYDVHPECNDQFQNSQFWPPISDPALEGINNAAIPTYLLDWMDTVYVPGQLHGSCTRLYGESSFDSLQITGDFIVVNLRESTVLNHGSFNRYNIKIVALNMISDNSAVTLYGRKHLEDFNAMNVLIRNITLAYGGINPGSGSGGVSTLQCVGDGDFFANPTNIVTHEISHGLFGTNDFHTSGGNHRDVGCAMPFLNIQGGYGLMGAANSGLVGCNGYERWRMHWKHPQAVDYISARNTSNTASVVSDISIEDGNKSFLLRDFVTYGDVVRIKLPYKDSENSPNQYIWLENHKIGENDKLDYLQYSNTHSCRPRGAAGIYAYYQVGRDVLEGTNSQVWDSYGRDNLRIISAEGFHDYVVVEDNYNLHCVSDNSHSYAMVRGKANPFGGYNDQEKQIVPADEDTVLYVANELAPWRIVVEGQNRDFIPFIGDNSDAFTGHTVINMGTNPSTCNTRTFHSNNPNHSIVINASSQEKNTSTTYLSGLSIEMVPVAGTGDFIINVTWDGYDITNDVRFTGNVALRDTAVLTQGNTITLAQNRTVAQDRRDPETGLFAGKTHFTLLSGSFFRQDTTSVLSLTENSGITVEAGAGYELGAGATLHVGAGCKATFSPDAFVTLKGIVDVDSGGVMTIYDTAYIGSQARIIVHPGGKLIVDGGTLTNASAKTHPKGSYESFFGNSSWEYDIYYLLTCYSDEYNPNFFNTCSGTISFEFDVQDTVMVDDKLYYKNSVDIWLTALLREDSTNGRLYARYMSGDDEEYLLCDMSLSEGDTFTLKGNSIWHYGDTDIKMVVDSVAFVSGKKVIYLTYVNNDYFYDYFYATSAEVAEYFKQYNISLRFIEGVGPIYGIFPPSNHITLEPHLPLLLCVHKDDTLCYMTHEVLGCYQTGSDVPVYQMPSMQIMPNPATTSITLSFETEEEVSGNIIIRDMVGRVCASLDITGNNSVVGISKLTQGIYTLTYTDKKNRRVTKKFVKM